MKGSYAIKGLSSAEAGLRTYYLRLRRLLHREPRFIVFSTIPKTGSTFLTRTMANLTGYAHSYLAFAYKNVEQELYLPRIVDNYGKGVVVHQHFKANEPNLDLLTEFSIQPIVLVRNIFDVLVSLRDHLNNYALDNIPSVLPPEDFRTFDPDRQLDWVVEFFAPWIIEYYVSWKYAERRSDIAVHWIYYERLSADWQSGIAEICNYLDMTYTAEQIENAINTAKRSKTAMSKFNKGRTGRGNTELSDAQKDYVRSLTDYYSRVDFSGIGL